MPTSPTVSIATRADATAWDAFVESRGDATGYHAWRWRRVFADAFGHDPVYLIARQGAAIIGVLPAVHIKSLLFGSTLTSLPFLNYGGVMADAQETKDALIEGALSVARDRRCGHVELRHTERQFSELPCKQHKVTMRLPIQPSMWEKLDGKVRNRIRKARKSGLEVERGGEELLRDFYNVFARNMRDLGTPVYSKRLFKHVLRVFPERAVVHVVRLKGKAIAAGLTYRTRTMLQLPWASAIREYNPLCPTTLLYWDAIQFAQESLAGVFDMGRSTPDAGTFRFKARWGAEPLPLHWEYHLLSQRELPNLSPANPKYQFAISLWQRLPLSLTRSVGPRIVRTIP